MVYAKTSQDYQVIMNDYISKIRLFHLTGYLLTSSNKFALYSNSWSVVYLLYSLRNNSPCKGTYTFLIPSKYYTEFISEHAFYLKYSPGHQ